MATNFGFLNLDGLGVGIALTEVLAPVSGELLALHDNGQVYTAYITNVDDGEGLPANFIDLVEATTPYRNAIGSAFDDKGLVGRVVANKTTFTPRAAAWAERPLGPDGITPIDAGEFRLSYVLALMEVCRTLSIPTTTVFEIQPTP